MRNWFYFGVLMTAIPILSFLVVNGYKSDKYILDLKENGIIKEVGIETGTRSLFTREQEIIYFIIFENDKDKNIDSGFINKNNFKLDVDEKIYKVAKDMIGEKYSSVINKISNNTENQ